MRLGNASLTLTKSSEDLKKDLEKAMQLKEHLEKVMQLKEQRDALMAKPPLTMHSGVNGARSPSAYPDSDNNAAPDAPDAALKAREIGWPAAPPGAAAALSSSSSHPHPHRRHRRCC